MRRLLPFVLAVALMAAGCGREVDPEVAGSPTTSAVSTTSAGGDETGLIPCPLTDDEVSGVVGAPLKSSDGDCLFLNETGSTLVSNVVLTVAPFDGAASTIDAVKAASMATDEVEGVGDTAFLTEPPGSTVLGLVVFENDRQYTIVVAGDDRTRPEVVATLRALYEAARR
ncbi:MAG: hypothetical protein ACRD1K_10275 [Acidimicrobiales bacterium]